MIQMGNLIQESNTNMMKMVINWKENKSMKMVVFTIGIAMNMMKII